MGVVGNIKLALGGTLVAIIGFLWMFGGVTGMVVAALREDWLSVVLSFLIPVYGAFYAVFIAVSALFGG